MVCRSCPETLRLRPWHTCTSPLPRVVRTNKPSSATCHPLSRCRRTNDGALGESSMRSILLAIILSLAGGSLAVAQESYSGDAAAAYQWVHSNAGPGQCGCFGLNGGGLSGSWNFRGPWSAVVDFSAEHTGS